jgi:hypothetical protein
MKSTTEKIILHFAKKPRLLFLTDGFGAMLTFICLYVILGNFSEYFGMPEPVLVLLSAFAACLGMYSFLCFLFLKKNPSLFISIISMANLIYCLLTLVFLVINFSLLTFLGVAYFVAEMAIIAGLVYLEIKAASFINKYGLHA